MLKIVNVGNIRLELIAIKSVPRIQFLGERRRKVGFVFFFDYDGSTGWFTHSIGDRRPRHIRRDGWRIVTA
jgi:hypothetical protein